MPRRIGEAFIQIRPDAKRLGSELRPAAEKAGGEAGEAGGERFGRDLTRRIGEAAGRAAQTLARPLLKSVTDVKDELRNVDRRTLDRVRHEASDLDREIDDAKRSADDLGDELRGVDRIRFAAVRAWLRGLRDDTSDTRRRLSAIFDAIPTKILIPLAITFAIEATTVAGVTAILTGAAAAGIGAGILIAAHDPAVQGAFTTLFTRMGGDLKRAAQPFVKPLMDAALQFSQLWATKVEPSMRRIFAALAPTVKPLVDGLVGLVEKALPGIEKMVTAAAPLIVELASHGPAIGEMLTRIGNTLSDPKVIDAAKQFLDLMLFLVEHVLPALVSAIAFVAVQQKRFSDKIADSLRTIKAAWDGLVSLVRGTPGRFADAFAGIGSTLFGAGMRLVQGFIGGIRAMSGRVRDALVGLLPGPLKQFAGMLGLASPSKVFRRFGQQTVAGYLAGLHDMAPDLSLSVRAIAPVPPRPALTAGSARTADTATLEELRAIRGLLAGLNLTVSNEGLALAVRKGEKRVRYA